MAIRNYAKTHPPTMRAALSEKRRRAEAGRTTRQRLSLDTYSYVRPSMANQSATAMEDNRPNPRPTDGTDCERCVKGKLVTVRGRY